MLKNTFVHIKGIGYLTERRIWESGIETWEDYIEKWGRLRMPENKKRFILEKVEESLKELKAGNHRYFRSSLPRRELWRAYREFESSTVFLDIETTGLGFEKYDITIIGLFDGKKVRTYIKGINLDDFQFELPKYRVMITFNGSRFDVPFIMAKYPNVRFDQIHIDLRFLLKRLGYTGGLKRIERDFEVARDEEIEGLRGADAVRLWKQYERGSDRALGLLIRYNSEDIRNLKLIMKKAYEDLKAQVFTH